MQSPAACQVEPLVSSACSSSTTSSKPSCARWYARLQPATPPPTIATLASSPTVGSSCIQTDEEGTVSDIQQALETIFSADSQLYQARGFQRRIGFGARPALIHIDLANAWTRPGNAFSCDGMDTIIPGVQRLNAAGRAKGIPIVYTTTAYAVTDGPELRHGPLAPQDPGRGPAARHRRRRDRRAHRPRAGRARIVKKRASAFFGTHLANMLRAAGVDTVIITGVTMAGCVRHTTEDAIGYGFRPIVVRECRRRSGRRRRRVEPVRHRRQVRRRRAARDGPRLPGGHRAGERGNRSRDRVSRKP